MSPQLVGALFIALGETLVMVVASSFFAALLGLPLALLLTATAPGHLLPHPVAHRVLGVIINATRSIPFIILRVSIFPLKRWVVGSSIGTAAAIVPLSLSAAPFVARLYEEALRGVDPATLVGASAMAGAIGSGGLGDLGIRYGYQRFQPAVMAAVVLVLILLVNGVQWLGERLARHLSRHTHS